jgi:hypothetical protein
VDIFKRCVEIEKTGFTVNMYIYDAFDTILQADVNTYNIVYDVQIQTLFYIQSMVKIRKDLLRLCHEKDMTTIIVSDSNMRENALGTVLHRHRGGRAGNINAWYLNSHMVYL